MAYGTLVPQPRVKPTPPALEGSLNHWTAGEVPGVCLSNLAIFF